MIYSNLILHPPHRFNGGVSQITFFQTFIYSLLIFNPPFIIMAKVLVSLVGAQSAPNVNFINEQKKLGVIARFLFISSRESERKDNNYSQATINACKITDNFTILQSDANSFDGTSKFLEGLEFSDDDVFIINLTGGTKMMALGCWLFFTQEKFANKTEFYYLTFGKNENDKIYP